MASTAPQQNIFAPPTSDELELFAPPTEQEVGTDLFAPPSENELGVPAAREVPRQLPEAEVARIAQKHGVDSAELRSLAPYYGATVETGGGLSGAAGEAAKYTAGFLGRSVGLEVPQLVYKKLQDEPMRKALDEIRELGRQQRGIIETATEIATPGGAIGQASKKVIPRIAGAAATGAIAGVAGSEEGRELPAAVTGAAIGGGLAGAGEVLRKVLTPTRAELDLVQKSPVNIDREIEEVARKTAQSEKAIEDAVLTNRPLTREEIEIVVREQVPEETLRKYTDELSEENKLYKQQLVQHEVDTTAIQRKFSDIEDGYRQVREVLQSGMGPIPFKDKLGNNIGQVRRFTATVRELSSKIDEAYANPKARGKAYTKQLEAELFANQEHLSKLLDEQDVLRVAIPQSIRNEKVKQKMLPILESLDEQANKLQKSLTELRAPSKSPVTEDLIKQGIVGDILESRTIQYARDVSGAVPRNLAEARELLLKNQSEGAYTPDRYRNWLRGEQGVRAAAEKRLRAPDQAGWFGQALNKLSDVQFVARGFDRRFGTNLEDTLARGNRALARATYALDKFRGDRDDIFRTAKKLGVDKSVVNDTRIYDALDTGKFEGLTPAEKQVADKFRKYWSDEISFVNNLVREKDPNIAVMNIPTRTNYVPKRMVDSPTVLRKIEQRSREILDDVSRATGIRRNSFSDIRPEEWKALGSDSRVQELRDALFVIRKERPESALDMSDKLQDLTRTREGNAALETFARSAMERVGEIPDFLLEKNLYKLANKSTINGLRHLYLRPTIDRLRETARVLRSTGGKVEAQYIENLVQDVIGVRVGTAAEALLRARVGIQRKLDEKIEQAAGSLFQQGYYKALQALPNIIETASRNIYPNVLGYWSLRAAIQNMTSAITKVAPELGGPYGMLSTLRGAVYTAKNLRRLVDRAKQMGTIPEDFARGRESAIAEGIQRSALWRIPAETLNGMAHAGMVLYRNAESWNRALVLGMGDILASDLARKSPAAIRSINRFPPFVRKQIAEASGDQKKISNILGGYLNDVTQYNYNKLSLSEFGRAMGPIFSTFSKWPTATAGDVLEEMRARGTLKGSQRLAMKYLMPMLVLQTVDAALGEATEFMGQEITSGELTDVQKRLMGTKGLSQSAPLGSLESITTGEMFTPPMVDALVQGIIVPIWKGDISQMGRAGQQAIGNFLPAMGMIRFLTDDMVTYLEGERPGGSGFVERSVEGAETLGRKIK